VASSPSHGREKAIQGHIAEADCEDLQQQGPEAGKASKFTQI
jgi:hypothetical protein